jgi:amino acid efflux transporter
VLVVVIASAIAVALPSRGGDTWHPFAPHGWWAVGTAANILVWRFVGWEAGAQLAGEFRSPEHDLPRAMTFAFAVVTVLYCGLGAATIAVTSGARSRVPLADLIAVGFGHAGRDATAVLAVALTMGTMNVYIAGASKLIASLGLEGALPRVLAGDSHRSVPRRPLVLIAVPGVVLLGALVAGFSSTDALIRATSACFIGVYVLALLSAVRILEGATRVMAAFTFVLVVVLAGFSGWYLAVPIAAAAAALGVRRSIARP